MYGTESTTTKKSGNKKVRLNLYKSCVRVGSACL